MFQAITNAIGNLWSKTDDEPEDSSENQSGFNFASSDQSSIISETNLEKQYDGKVTSLHSGYGLIDSEVYFSYDVIKDGVPRVGDVVRVVARRKHETAGWKAIKVCFPFK